MQIKPLITKEAVLLSMKTYYNKLHVPLLENVMRKINDFWGAFERKNKLEKIYKLYLQIKITIPKHSKYKCRLK